jgi:hypothetical protein
MTLKIVGLAAGLLVLSAVPAAAHHSFSAMYDAAKPVRLTGKLTKIEWTWACEGAGPGALSRRGFKQGDIKIGDSIVVDGYLAKSGAKIVDARRVTLPNGRVINGGTPGDGGPGDPAAAPRAQ